MPGGVDGFELAVRAIVGQQVSVAAARTVLGRLVARYGEPLSEPARRRDAPLPDGRGAGRGRPGGLPFPRRRGEALRSLARLVAVDGCASTRAPTPRQALAALLDIPGVGPWTASYVAMRALGDPDAFLPGDVGVQHALRLLGGDAAAPDGWRPWRSYAVMHLWSLVSAAPDGRLVADQPDEVPERDVRVHEVQAPAGVGRRVEHGRAA